MLRFLSLQRATPPLPSGMHCPTGARSRATSMMVCWRSIIALPKGRFERSRSGGRTACFFCADSSGERAASFYTLIGTAKLCGLDPSFYLRTVLARIAEHPINRIAELLPWNLAADLQSEPAEAA